MNSLTLLLLTGSLLSSLLLPTRKPKPKPVRKGLPTNIDWSKVVH